MRRLSKLPSRVHLGRGHTIEIILVTQTQISAMLDEDEPNSNAAFWDDEQHTIYIDKSLSRGRQWDAYFHELCHACHDIAEANRGGV